MTTPSAIFGGFGSLSTFPILLTGDFAWSML